MGQSTLSALRCSESRSAGARRKPQWTDAAGTGRHSAARIPEKLAPGKVNLIGSSHQLFHVAVVLASWVHWKGLVHMAVREMRRGLVER